jgi:hypothetical protein
MVRYCLAYKPLVLITQAGSFAHQVLSFGRSLSGLGERTLNLAPHGENYFGFSLVRHRTRSPTTEADYQRLVVGGNYSARSIGAAEQHSTYGLRLAGLPGRRRYTGSFDVLTREHLVYLSRLHIGEQLLQIGGPVGVCRRQPELGARLVGSAAQAERLELGLYAYCSGVSHRILCRR